MQTAHTTEVGPPRRRVPAKRLQSLDLEPTHHDDRTYELVMPGPWHTITTYENDFRADVYSEEHKTPPLVRRLSQRGKIRGKEGEKEQQERVERDNVGAMEASSEGWIEAGKNTVTSYGESALEVVWEVGSHWLASAKTLLCPTVLMSRLLLREMESADSYYEWFTKAVELDVLEGKQKWKMEFHCDLYDSLLLERRLEELRRARKMDDVRQMMFLLRSGLFRNLGNMGNPTLYSHCHVGTKRLIEKYTEEVVYQLDLLANRDWPDVTFPEILAFYKETRQAFGRTALMLSGGGSFGMYHLGVVKALWENQLLPRIICGSSAGAIVSSLLCTRTDQEVEDMLVGGKLGLINAIKEPDSATTLLGRLRAILERGALADNDNLQMALREQLGDVTFQEAYTRTRRILNISVNSTNPHEAPRLLNFLTAPNVVIWSAACASSALKGLFKPFELIAKTKEGNLVPWGFSGEEWSDGSIECDLPMTRLSELFNINHFIVSQLNPHVIPFIHPRSPIAIFSNKLPGISELLWHEIRHRLNQAAQLTSHGSVLRLLSNMANQKYMGDITIFPDIEARDYLRVFKNPDEEFMAKSKKIGERSTWPKLSQIRVRCAIELALDRTFYLLQGRIFDQDDNVLSQTDYLPSANQITKMRARHHRERSGSYS